MGLFWSKFCKQFSVMILRLQLIDVIEVISCMIGYGYSQCFENKIIRIMIWKELLLYRK